MPIPFYQGPVPALSRLQMIEVDRAMIEDYNITLIQMMENAGRNLAHLARVRFLGQNPVEKRVVVLAGAGGNGGAALVAARRLHNWGASVTVVTSRPPAAYSGAAARQLEIVQRLHITIAPTDELSRLRYVNLLVDGLIGYSLRGAPRGMAATLIRWANMQDAPVLALDTPSGIDVETGAALEPAIRAAATMTLALPKHGLLTESAAAYVGELYLADISVPPELYAARPLGLEVGPVFAAGDVVRLR